MVHWEEVTVYQLESQTDPYTVNNKSYVGEKFHGLIGFVKMFSDFASIIIATA